MLAIGVVGVVLYVLLPKVMALMKKVVVILVIIGGLAALYAMNGNDWGNVFITLIDAAYYIVNWVSDQFVSIFDALSARF